MAAADLLDGRHAHAELLRRLVDGGVEVLRQLLVPAPRRQSTARMHARTHARTRTRARARTHTHTHTHTHQRGRVLVLNSLRYSSGMLHTHTRTHTHTHTHTHTCQLVHRATAGVAGGGERPAHTRQVRSESRNYAGGAPAVAHQQSQSVPRRPCSRLLCSAGPAQDCYAAPALLKIATEGGELPAPTLRYR